MSGSKKAVNVRPLVTLRMPEGRFELSEEEPNDGGAFVLWDREADCEIRIPTEHLAEVQELIAGARMNIALLAEGVKGATIMISSEGQKSDEGVDIRETLSRAIKESNAASAKWEEARNPQPVQYDGIFQGRPVELLDRVGQGLVKIRFATSKIEEIVDRDAVDWKGGSIDNIDFERQKQVDDALIDSGMKAPEKVRRVDEVKEAVETINTMAAKMRRVDGFLDGIEVKIHGGASTDVFLVRYCEEELDTGWFPVARDRVELKVPEDEEVEKISEVSEAIEARVSMREAVFDLHYEVDCRIAHGADSGGHLEYVREKLNDILNPEA